MELSHLIQDIQKIILQSRERAVRSVNTERVLMYWQIGKRIFEEEQNGKDRAEYGLYLIKNLSEKLSEDFGNGFSSRNLELMRLFFRTFPIAQTLSTQLSWSHYSLLLSIDSQDKREFYIAEIKKNNWSVRELERQLNSQFYERLLLSTDKETLLAIARKERIPENPSEIIKDPMVLEFLGLKRESSYYEKDLESAIITHLHDFLLELGNGFAFVARQKRIHLDGDDFYIDLVFYNRLLSCFVLIEIKTQKLTHQDLGQLQMYVNYYDREEKLPSEKPTLGILLCADKNNSMVKYALPENNRTIFASSYQLYLPSEKQLLEELKKEFEKRSEL
ncbi:putative nuclease of restriction endonuclease-like (RecB) superfamily [Algoriphagus aquaeductus]|uniref:Putative nuclease of restriction endonuclease-like (RecB) superfamily n=1 Tax=Algoriphagus aquaeductus TaxID=475299 RepID=A0A326RR85_9BACT|nr:PDDEXK nuclease domain-containing protein [Algoriphagus aquaeductus]PZV83913.1 putative nuclease of restriction endonuclease-like (RecB) superfamily [Algoriphagus aquaeductus]